MGLTILEAGNVTQHNLIGETSTSLAILHFVISTLDYYYYYYYFVFFFPGPSLIAAFYAEELTLTK